MNTELLLRVYDRVVAHPETWDQRSWAQVSECNTTYCVAGWACVLSGEEIALPKLPGTTARLVNGESISSAAQRLMGITERTADVLFFEVGSLEELREAIESLTGVDPDDRVVAVTP